MYAMTDEELADWLCIKNVPNWQKFIAELAPEKRKAYDRLREVCKEWEAWKSGGPKPENVFLLIDEEE